MRLFDGWRDWVQRVVGKIVVNFGPHTIHRLVAGLGLCLYHGVISISVTGTGWWTREEERRFVVGLTGSSRFILEQGMRRKRRTWWNRVEKEGVGLLIFPPSLDQFVSIYRSLI